MTCQDTSIRAMAPAPTVLQSHRRLAEGDRQSMAPDAKLGEPEWHALLGEKVQCSHRVLAKPVQSWGDVAPIMVGGRAMAVHHRPKADPRQDRFLFA